MTTPMTAPEAIEEISAMIRDQDPMNSCDVLVLRWRELMFTVEAIGEHEIGVQIHAPGTVDYVWCHLPADAAVELIDTLTEDNPEGTDHAAWAVQWAMDNAGGTWQAPAPTVTDDDGLAAVVRKLIVDHVAWRRNSNPSWYGDLADDEECNGHDINDLDEMDTIYGEVLVSVLDSMVEQFTDATLWTLDDSRAAGETVVAS